MIRLRQIAFDIGVERRLFVWILRRFFEDVICAGIAEEISDQHPARTIHEAVDGYRVLAFVFHLVNGTRHATWAKIVGVEPERFHRIAELSLALNRSRLVSWAVSFG